MVGVHEDALGGRQPVDQPLTLQSIVDDLSHGADAELVLTPESLQLRQAGHFSVLPADLTDDGGRMQPGEPHEVHRPLGLSGPDENPSVTGPERHHVTRPHQVVRSGAGLREKTRRPRPLRRRDARAHSVPRVPVHGDGHRGAAERGVRGGLGVQLEAVAVGRGERHAEIPRGVARHEVDDRGRDLLGRADEVPFVLAVLVVDEDDGPAAAEVLQDLGDRREHGLSP